MAMTNSEAVDELGILSDEIRELAKHLDRLARDLPEALRDELFNGGWLEVATHNIVPQLGLRVGKVADRVYNELPA